MTPARIFLLSPADCGGRRADVLLRPGATFDLAVRLRGESGAELGEVFSFLSGLYFRGKLAYAQTFASPPAGLPPALVISAGRGLVSPAQRVTLEDIRAFATIPIDPAEPRYVVPLRAAAERLASSLPDQARVVLLGSIATRKYVEILLEALGDRLCFPQAFIGIGDMSRGAILLRAAAAGVELEYVTARGAIRSTARGARLT